MGAPAWTIQIGDYVLDMRKLDTKQQRAAIFEVVKTMRERRDAIASA